MQKAGAGSGDRRAGSFHKFGAGHTGGDGALVELTDLRGSDRFHR
jgi:hypothetical protein